MKKRLLSLCSGIGGIDYAWSHLLGQEIAGQVENDPYCQALLHKQWPNVVKRSDIREVHGDEFGAIDLVAGGVPCFIGSTLILTKQGYKPIETIAVGDYVLSHLGRWQPVTSVMKRNNAQLRCVKAQGTPGVITTDEHPFFARKQRQYSTHIRGKAIHKRDVAPPEWIAAKDLNTHYYAAQVLPQAQSSEQTSAFWWVVGRYLADGWIAYRASRSNEATGKERLPRAVIICCNYSERNVLKHKIQDAGYHTFETEERTTVRFYIANVTLCSFLTQFGCYAQGKFLPGFAFELEKEKVKALLDGYITGDGYRDQDAHAWKVTTISKPLALSVALLAQRAYGVVASVRRCVMKKQTKIEGRTVNQKDFYIISIPDSNRSAFVENDYGWKLVRSSEPCGVGTVYNISVAEDESYVADGTVVHNCQPFSLSGQRRGTDDDRHLWPAALPIIERCQPTWVLIENVVGFVSLALDLVQTDLESAGYTSQAYVLPACAVGAPHTRERVFIVAHSTRGRWGTWGTQLTRQQGTLLTDGNGASCMAHSRCPGCGQWAHQSEPQHQCNGTSDTRNDGTQGGMAHANRQRQQECDVTTGGRASGLVTWGTDAARDGAYGQSQPRMGREFDGLSCGMDRPRWPSPPNQTQEEWEPSRTIPNKLKHRASRLKALGNAVVPQQVYPILKAIVDIEHAYEEMSA